jgi:hypothetical protein
MRVGEAALAANLDWWPIVWKVTRSIGPGKAPQSPLTDEELETHDDLAVAYAEMGLLPDAFGEAALVLGKGAGRVSASALDIVFDARVAHFGAMSELRRRLFPS